ncbi:MAG TPA: hypothetical protein PLH27_02435 [bacterium]|nr:hypothetical protein [bacterium]HMW33505.1 hypothetical protein [bacterium]HMW35279.1 hypothetical protein [bacterium]HMY35987.1 hypothetical protein [bacterium]HMZ04855.1 hypothetical protein [bacterium]
MKTLLMAVCFFVLQDQPAFDPSLMYGRWKWYASEGGLMEQRITVEQTQQNKSLLFTKDHAVFYMVGDSVSYKSRYVTEMHRSEFTGQDTPLLRIQGISKDQWITMQGKDSLILRENKYDGWTHRYVRLH